MSRRLIAGIAAGLLALIGAILLVGYVNSADKRAMAGMDPVEVLVVSAPIPRGTPAEDLASSVAVEELPRAAIGPGAVRSLSELTGRVAATDMQAGEQLLSGRFATPDSMAMSGGIPAPAGFHQVTIPLDTSARVVGGSVRPGDTVGVFVSLGDTTHLVLNKVLVTRVQTNPTPNKAVDGAAPIPEGATLVTLALTASQAETVVFAAENARVWLSLEDAETPTDGTRLVDPGNVYR